MSRIFLPFSFLTSLFLEDWLTTWNFMKRTKILWTLVVRSWHVYFVRFYISSHVRVKVHNHLKIRPEEKQNCYWIFSDAGNIVSSEF